MFLVTREDRALLIRFIKDKVSNRPVLIGDPMELHRVFQAFKRIFRLDDHKFSRHYDNTHTLNLTQNGVTYCARLIKRQNGRREQLKVFELSR